MDLDLSTLSAPPSIRRGAPFRLLVVCTGNICRSAFAAALLQTRLADALPVGTVVVESAGTDVAPTVLMPAVVQDAILGLGADPDEHLITPLDTPAIESADLILTMTARQRAAVVRVAPAAAARVQMLTQFARLCGAEPDLDPGIGDPADAMRSVASAAIARRGVHAGVDADIVDPWGRDDAFFIECLAQIRSYGDVIAERLVSAGRSAG